MADKKRNNTTLERGVKTYLPPLYYKLFVGYVYETGMSESSSACTIIRKFFDELPPQDKEKYLRYGGNNQSKNSY